MYIPKIAKKIVVLLFLLIILEFSGVLPYIIARITSSFYIIKNYPNHNFKFQSAEYAYGFGDYSTLYINNSDEKINLMLYPKEFPIFIRYDSLKKNP